MLNEHPGLLRATKFVGQSQGKQEKDKGFNQKEQKKVRDCNWLATDPRPSRNSRRASTTSLFLLQLVKRVSTLERSTLLSSTICRSNRSSW